MSCLEENASISKIRSSQERRISLRKTGRNCTETTVAKSLVERMKSSEWSYLFFANETDGRETSKQSERELIETIATKFSDMKPQETKKADPLELEVSKTMESLKQTTKEVVLETIKNVMEDEEIDSIPDLGDKTKSKIYLLALKKIFPEGEKKMIEERIHECRLRKSKQFFVRGVILCAIMTWYNRTTKMWII